MKYLITFIITIISISSCKDNENIFYPDLDEDYRRILRLAENEFRSKLNEKYKSDDDYQNLTQYLESLSNANPQILGPSKNLQIQIKRGPVIRDIWNTDKSVNSNSEFIKCISKSKSRFLSEYYSSLIYGGDMSPYIFAKSLIIEMEKNGKNEYIFPLATINLFLITLN